SEILEQLFTYMKVQNETYELPLEEVNINRLIYNSMFSFYENFRRKGIEPKIQIPEEPYYILLNQNAFTRIMQNMIKNVLEHGTDEFELTVIEEEKTVTITCKNEYASEELLQIEQIFERFYKADEARKHSSTGLGLAIVKSLVVRMGGTIRAYKGENGKKNQLCIEVVFKR
ncbi:MAG: HAMP domain-containing sensor histidine kinase, partial [bacterium]|nr:HAMP domain-containing sensor histidine kinase [bacterium]